MQQSNFIPPKVLASLHEKYGEDAILSFHENDMDFLSNFYPVTLEIGDLETTNLFGGVHNVAVVSGLMVRSTLSLLCAHLPMYASHRERMGTHYEMLSIDLQSMMLDRAKF